MTTTEFPTITCWHCHQPRWDTSAPCVTCNAPRTPVVQQWTPPTAAAPTATSRPSQAGGIAAILGGAGLILGSFLPWAKVSAPFIGTITKSGMEGGDGIFSLAAGVLAVLLGITLLSRPHVATRIVLLLTGMGGVALALFEANDISHRFADARAQSDLVVPTYGAGLWLIGVAAVLVIAAAFISAANAARANR